MTLETKIAAKIKERGAPVTFVSKQTGISPQVLYRMLSGRRELKADEYLSICAWLKEDPSELAVGTSADPRR